MAGRSGMSWRLGRSRRGQSATGDRVVESEGPDADTRWSLFPAPYKPVGLNITDAKCVDSQQAALRNDILILYKQSVYRLSGRISRKGQREVIAMLQEAVDSGIVRTFTAEARIALDRASAVYAAHVATRNRVWYLVGVLLGFAMAATVLVGLESWLGREQPIHTWLGSFDDLGPQVLIPLFSFAGMGTFVSVLGRISKLDLADESSVLLLVVSGAARPLIAIFFAAIVYVIIKNQLIPIQIGSTPTTMPGLNGTRTAGVDAPNGMLYVAYFLCGFSERFASDLVTSLPLYSGKTPTDVDASR
jgi:hypothetical protein